MRIVIILFGIFIILMSGIMLARPKSITDFMLRQAGEPWLHVAAVAVRIVLGIALVLSACQSRFPLALEIIGWIAIAAGVILALTPPAKFRRMIKWAIDRFGRFMRPAAVAALLFGAFLVYAVA
jgi:hypothetical protein